MSLRENAIVAYAETKVMKKRDRDVWVLMGEILNFGFKLSNDPHFAAKLRVGLDVNPPDVVLSVDKKSQIQPHLVS